MNKLEELTKDLPAVAVDSGQFSEMMHPRGIRESLEEIRRWSGVAASPISLSTEFFSGLLGRGREGVLRIFEGFCGETRRTDQEATEVFDSLRRLARQGKVTKAIAWDLDDIRLDAVTVASRPRLVIRPDPGLETRVRAAAAARNESLNFFCEEALRERLARLERAPRPYTRTAKKRRASEPQPQAEEAATA